MCKLFGKGTPRSLARTLPAIFSAVLAPIRAWSATATLVKGLGEPMVHLNLAQLIKVVA